MVAITSRPAPGSTKCVCLNCHQQFLQVLSPEQFKKDRRAGTDEGYWTITLAVSRCNACRPAQSVSEWCRNGIKHFVGIDDSVTVEVCLTAKQYAEAVTSATVGAVTHAKDTVHNGNIQLCNMRSNSIVGDKICTDTLYKQAVFEIWPYLAALLSSEAAETSTFNNGWCCCGGRTAVLRDRKYTLNVPDSAFGKLQDQPDVDLDGPTADEQIFGPALASKLQDVSLITDADSTPGIPTTDDALAVKFCPTSEDRVFHADTPEKLQEAVDKRITEKYVPFDLTEEERGELEGLTESLCDEIRNSDSIERIASWLLFGDLQSKKWSHSRAEMALNCLMWRLLPEYQFKAAIKLEPMPRGKPPRMLIADGDAGAVMSALTIGVLERYLCKYHAKKTIKGKPKATRMMEICREAHERKGDGEPYEAFMLENDGSAWDTCCSLMLRDLTENKILDVMYDKLYPFFTPYNWFQEKRKNADTARKHTLGVKTSKVKVDKLSTRATYTIDDAAKVLLRKEFKIKIDAIRRSGDRGTSILNFLVNLICWAWVLGRDCGTSMVGPNGKVVHDIFKSKRRFRIWLEGDDSMLWLTGRGFTPAEIDELERRWIKLGHRPKLFMRVNGDVAEFCGWKICVCKYGLDEHTAVPDVPRMLKNLGYSTAKEAVAAAIAGDGVAFARVIGPSMLARAGSIAERVPSIARWIVKMAQHLGLRHDLSDEEFTRDDVFKMGTDDMTELLPEFWKDDDPVKLCCVRYESFASKIHKEISNSIASGGVRAEAQLAIRHGWVKSESEWCHFVTCLEAVSLGTSDADFRSIIPPGMMV